MAYKITPSPSQLEYLAQQAHALGLFEDQPTAQVRVWYIRSVAKKSGRATALGPYLTVTEAAKDVETFYPAKDWKQTYIRGQFVTLSNPGPRFIEYLAVFLSDLSEKDMGGGLSFDQNEIILRQAEKIPAFGHWVAQCEDLDPVFAWLQAYEDAQNGHHPSADCIASGYETTCPICEAHIHTIEITPLVTCPTCGTVYEGDLAEHAEY